MGTAFLNSLSIISTNDCCTLLLTCLEKAFHVGSAAFTAENFKYMVCLKKFSLQKVKTLIKNIGELYLNQISLHSQAHMSE